MAADLSPQCLSAGASALLVDQPYKNRQPYMAVTATPAQVDAIGVMLADRSVPVSKRFRAIFTLRNIGGNEAVEALVKGFADDSALLKHEIAFVLGQMQNPVAVPHLIEVLRDLKEDSMVRHEAGEALGAIGAMEALAVLQQFAADPIPEVAETCQLAVDRLLWLKNRDATSAEGEDPSPYESVDPAPPAKEKSVPQLAVKLLNGDISMFERYRALFALRNKGGPEAIDAMAAAMDDPSALLRHEIAYVMGQMQDAYASEALKKALAKRDEHPMVRHEAAEALGSIASPESLPLMQQYAGDEERVVRESCEVALDVADYMSSGAFEYADALIKVKAAEKAAIESVAGGQ